MQAIRIHQQGDPEVMQLEELPTPEPGPGQALVKVAAIGVNFLDIYQRSGLYPMTLPFIPGSEGAGTVEAVGPDVTFVKLGDRVAWTSLPHSYATHLIAPTDRLVPLPEGLSFEDGAAAMLQGLTAHYLCHSTYPLKPGDHCLVQAAAGGVGLLLCQMAKRLGATVYGTVSTQEKAELARAAGADVTILYTRVDFLPEVKRLTDGRGVQVVYDSVGKDTFDRSLASLAPRGYLVLYGQSSGPVPPFDPRSLNQGSYFLTRPSLGHYTQTREELMARANDVLGWVASGQLKLRREHTYPLSEAIQAHRDLAGRKTTGKLLLIP